MNRFSIWTQGTQKLWGLPPKDQTITVLILRTQNISVMREIISVSGTKSLKVLAKALLAKSINALTIVTSNT